MGSLKLSEELLSFLRELPDIELDSLISCYERSMPETFRLNTLKATAEEVLPLLREEEGLEVRPIHWLRHGYLVSPEGHLSQSIWHQLGLIYFQGPVSMLASELLDVEPGHLVLDMCAAPGSKSTHIGQLLSGRGVLVANDISSTRVKALASNLQRCGVLNAVLTMWDGKSFGRRARGFFDRVIVDAPCSSLGIVSKDWGVARDWHERVSQAHSRLQKRLILSGFDSLKSGGILLYSTCTLHPVENEEVVSYLLEERPNAEILEIRLHEVGFRHGLVEWRGKLFREEVEKCVRIYPYHSGAEGFFFAKLVKTADGM